MPETPAPRSLPAPGETTPPLASPVRLPARAGWWACALVFAFMLNDSVVEEGDAIANINAAFTFIDTGGLAFSPRKNPEMFNWQGIWPLRPRSDFYVRSWREPLLGKAAGVWKATGHLRLNGPRYFAVKSPVRDAYVGTFGIVPGLTFVPLATLAKAINPATAQNYAVKLTLAKLHAGMLVALTTLLLFAMARGFTRAGPAAVIAFAFAFGTGAWAIASQTLWQQTVSAFLLTLGAFAFLRAQEAPRWLRLCGFALGAATACRPTSLLFFIAVGAYVFIHQRKQIWVYVLSSAPLPLLLAAYNHYYFGAPWRSAQELVSRELAIGKVGTPSLWGTPFWEGLLGLLASPSRGLLVFSPFLILAVWGATRVLKQRELRPLVPLLLAALGVMAIQCKWYDWWGGWTYGCRPWLDVTPMLALMLAPIASDVLARRWLSSAALLLLMWSVVVQGLGALSYDKSWNARKLHRVDRPDGYSELLLDEPSARALATATRGELIGPYDCNIDLPECRYRLWSSEDNIIGYYWQRFSLNRAKRNRLAWLDPVTPDSSAPSR